jgi:heme a synthase
LLLLSISANIVGSEGFAMLRFAQRRPGVLNKRADHALGWWLVGIIVLLLTMIVVGGLTRLTDSGLSIVEWRPVTGTVPPLTREAWLEELEKYRQIPEYQLQNRGMSMAEFQFIYWWEWGHRFLGRLIGLAFFVPFVLFAVKGWLRRDLNLRLLGLFALGGFQGFIGWWMVSSGLTERVDVSHYRLATHLGVAFIILGLAWWTMRDAFAGRSIGFPKWRTGSVGMVFIALLFVQILWGALVSGLDAGRIFNTWPLMEGRIVPLDYMTSGPWYHDAFENRASVQFHHRIGAYLVLAFGLYWAFRLWRRTELPAMALLLSGVLVWQVALGVVTLLLGSPLWAAALHQLSAAILLIVAIQALRAETREFQGSVAA